MSQCGEEHYYAIVKAAQSKVNQVEQLKRSERQYEEAKKGMNEALRAQKMEKEDIQKNLTAQFDEELKIHNLEKQKLDQELSLYKERILQLEKELKAESQAKGKREEELRHEIETSSARHEQTKMLAEELRKAQFWATEKEEEFAAFEEDCKAKQEILKQEILKQKEQLDLVSHSVRELEEAKEHTDRCLLEERASFERERREWESQRDQLMRYISELQRSSEEEIERTGKKWEAFAVALADKEKSERERLLELWEDVRRTAADEANEYKAAIDVAERRLGEERALREATEQSLEAERRNREQLVAHLEEELHELRNCVSALRREKGGLSEDLAKEREKAAQLRKDLQCVGESFELEKSLREKVAAELFAEIDARYEVNV